MSDKFKRLADEQEQLRGMAKISADVERQRKLTADIGGMGKIGADIERQRKLMAGIADVGGMAKITADIERQRKLMAGIADVGGMAKITADIERQRKMIEGPIVEARRLGLFDPTSDLRSSMAMAMTARQDYESLFRLPKTNEIGQLAREAVAGGGLASNLVRDQGDLRTAMAGVRSPWLRIEEASTSARAFSEILAIGRGIDARLSFDATYVDALRPSLGDWRELITPTVEPLINPLFRTELYQELGLNSTLTDFTPPAFDESLRLAGLYNEGEDSADEQDNDGFARANAAFEQLRRFEIALRRFIDRVMLEAYGEGWMKRQLPGCMLDSWRDKRDKALKAGESEQPLIDYADFSDYRTIIERKDNWNTVFRPVFGRAEDVRESFQRLFPVRIATMHARLVTLDDELLLRVETRRVLKAIGNLD